jgi:hypothetical protein
MGSHHIVLHSAVRACPGYDPHEAPSISLDGVSTRRDTQHGRALADQRRRDHGTVGDAIAAGVAALRAAGVPWNVRRRAERAAREYLLGRLSLAASDGLSGRGGAMRGGTEPMPDGMRRALEDLVALIVDRRYDELAASSDGRLAVDDLRRRIEEDYPVRLVLPPPEHYTVEAISESPRDGQWFFFLDLWDEEGEADLHIDGKLDQAGDDRFLATLDDIAF